MENDAIISSSTTTIVEIETEGTTTTTTIGGRTINHNSDMNQTSNSNNDTIILPRNNKEYGTKEYWEQRFEKEQSFEWLVSYQQIKHQIEPILIQYCYINNSNNDNNTTCNDNNDSNDNYNDTNISSIDKSKVRILIVGCGNAPFSADLYDDGYSNIINIDYSYNVIQHMKQLHEKQRPYMKWYVIDMIHMKHNTNNNDTTNTNTETDIDDSTIQFQNESFDIVIDKAAMDAIMTNEQDVWYPNIEVIQNVYEMCYNISNLLKSQNNNGGTFIQISLSQPHFRKKYLLHLHRTSDNDNDNDNDKVDDNSTTNSLNGLLYCPQFKWTYYSEPAGRNDNNSSNSDSGGFGHYIYIMKKI